jgi:ribosome recycling factor
MIDQILAQTREKMRKAVEVTSQDLSTIRSGRATPALVENIIISAYGGSAKMKLTELATISTTDAKTIVIQPFDPSVKAEIEKGILEANIGLTPIVDGEIIRISIPSLTEERRREFIKLAHTKIEAGKIMLRQARQDMLHEVKKEEENSNLNEDQKKLLEKQIQEITDTFVSELETLKQKKEAELLQI